MAFVEKRRFSFKRGLPKHRKTEEDAPMNMEVAVAEAVELINEIRDQPENIFAMNRANVQQSVGQYLSDLMDAELTHFLGRERYQRIEGQSNHRIGSYGRRFTLKGIGEVGG